MIVGESMDVHVRLQIALGGKGSRTNSTAKRTFARVSAIVHFQGTLAGQDTFAHDTFVRVAFTCASFELLDHVFQLERQTRTSMLFVRRVASVVDAPWPYSDLQVRPRVRPSGTEWTMGSAVLRRI